MLLTTFEKHLNLVLNTINSYTEIETQVPEKEIELTEVNKELILPLLQELQDMLHNSEKPVEGIKENKVA